jgi:hypothetical protein
MEITTYIRNPGEGTMETKINKFLDNWVSERRFWGSASEA